MLEIRPDMNKLKVKGTEDEMMRMEQAIDRYDALMEEMDGDTPSQPAEMPGIKHGLKYGPQ